MPTTQIPITITTPAGLTIAEVLSVLTQYWHYDPAGGQTPAQFVQAKIGQFLRESYIAGKATADAEAARASAIATAGQITAG